MELDDVKFFGNTFFKYLILVQSVGFDGIPPLVLKRCAPKLTPVLGKLVSLSFATEILPKNMEKHSGSANANS